MAQAAAGLGSQLLAREGSVLVGDLGLLSLRIMLEMRLRWILGTWQDPDNPIDVVIGGARSSVFEPFGMFVRRMRGASAATRDVQSLIDRGAEGGLVVWPGARGVRPALERFAELAVAAPVVVITRDPDVARSRSMVCFDPLQTADGLRAALVDARNVSAALRRPVAVLLRRRMMDIRGTLTCGPVVDVAQIEVAPADVVDVSEIVARASGIEIRRPDPPSDAVGHVVIVPAPLAGIVAPMAGRSVVVARSLAALESAEARGVIARASRVVVVDDRRYGCIAASCAHHAAVSVKTVVVDIEECDGRAVAREIERQLRSTEHAEVANGTNASPIPAAAIDVAMRLPGRAERLQLGVPPSIAIALTIAQAAIDIPARLDPKFPTWQTPSGATLTVVDAATFARQGVAAGGPIATTGTFLVHGGAGNPAEAVSAASGATVEVVDSSQPRAIAEALARSCAMPRAHPHVVIAQPAAAPIRAGVAIGCEPEVIRGDRLTMRLLDEHLVARVPSTEPLDEYPDIVVRDPVAAQSMLPGLSGVSDAWYRVAARPARGAVARMRTTLRRRMFRSLVRMEA